MQWQEILVWVFRSTFWAFLCIHVSQTPFGQSLWSGHHWKDLFLLQKLSIAGANFGQKWWRQKRKKGQGSSRAVTGGTGVNGLRQWYQFRPIASSPPPSSALCTYPVNFLFWVRQSPSMDYKTRNKLCFIVRTMLSFFVSKRKINFKHLIARWDDVLVNSVGELAMGRNQQLLFKEVYWTL